MFTNFATADLSIAFTFAASIEPRKPGFPIRTFAFHCGYSGHIIFFAPDNTRSVFKLRSE